MKPRVTFRVRSRVAIAAGIVAFLTFAGTGVSFAYWASTASTSGNVAVASPSTTNCVSPTKLLNGSFENPNITPNAYSQLAPALVPNWSLANDNVIEIWRGQGAIVPPTGAQLAELNGNGFGTLYQDVVTVPGQTLRWSVQHRGRDGTDGMKVSINAAGAALVQVDQFTDPMGPWVLHTGAYVVPAGQTSTRLSLTPTSTFQNNPSIGNLIDDITFGSGPCLQATSTVVNATTGLSGFRVGDTVEYVTTVTNTGGAPATPSAFSAVVPTSLAYVAGSMQVNGMTRTDAVSDDQAEYNAATKTISARIGTNSTAATGGIVSTEGSVTIRYRATVLAVPVGSSISYAPTVAYADLFAPLWPLSATATPVAFTVSAGSSADVAVAVLASPTITASGAASWTYRVTNNGPLAAATINVALGLTAGPTYSAVTVTTSNAGPAIIPCSGTGTARTCTIATLPSGEGRTITVTGAIPAGPVGLYPVTSNVTSATFDYVATNDSATNNGIDGIAPTAPGSLTATRVSETSIQLGWNASTDNVGGVTGYRIFRNGALLTNVGVVTGYTDDTVVTGQPYWYWVQAFDAANNVSAASIGEGAVTFSTTGSYRIYYPNSNPDRCLGARNGNDNAALEVQNCATDGNQRWTFVVVAGDVARVQPFTGPTRRWSMAADSVLDGTGIILDLSNIAVPRASWDVGVVWDGTTAYLRFANGQSGRCLNSPSLTGTNGTDLEQLTCSATSWAQRFTMVPYS